LGDLGPVNNTSAAIWEFKNAGSNAVAISKSGKNMITPF
jgi:hypothetical protein